jgi:hypothetical protein
MCGRTETEVVAAQTSTRGCAAPPHRRGRSSRSRSTRIPRVRVSRSARRRAPPARRARAA